MRPAAALGLIAGLGGAATLPATTLFTDMSDTGLGLVKTASLLLPYAIFLGVGLLVALGIAVVQLRAAHAHMHELAMTDELTGLANRRAMIARLEALLASLQSAPIALLIIDIDHFKHINDRHGHLAGDAALRCVASMLRAAAPEPAMVARQGGEEFVILLPEAQIEQAAAMAEDFRERISLLDCTRWQGIERMTASIGVTVSPALGENPDDLLRRADSALYAAKRAGRNCVRVVAHSPVAVPPVQESFAEFTTPEARAARRR